MSSRHLKQYSFLPLLLLIFLLGLRTAEACSCARSPTVLDEYNHSDVVVIVSAVSVEKAAPEQTAAPGYMSNGENYVDGVKSTSMRVEQVFKGPLKVGDEMIFVQGGGADCIWTFDKNAIGKKFLFYVDRLKGSTRWMAVTCGRSSRLDLAGDDLLYRLIKQMGSGVKKVRTPPVQIEATHNLYGVELKFPFPFCKKTP